MEVKKTNPKQNVEVKGYSANQSVDVRKGYNPQMTTQESVLFLIGWH